MTNFEFSYNTQRYGPISWCVHRYGYLSKDWDRTYYPQDEKFVISIMDPGDAIIFKLLFGDKILNSNETIFN